jgi:hypothetical protein
MEEDCAMRHPVLLIGPRLERFELPIETLTAEGGTRTRDMYQFDSFRWTGTKDGSQDRLHSRQRRERTVQNEWQHA